MHGAAVSCPPPSMVATAPATRRPRRSATWTPTCPCRASWLETSAPRWGACPALELSALGTPCCCCSSLLLLAPALPAQQTVYTAHTARIPESLPARSALSPPPTPPPVKSVDHRIHQFFHLRKPPHPKLMRFAQVRCGGLVSGAAGPPQGLLRGASMGVLGAHRAASECLFNSWHTFFHHRNR